MIEAKRAAVLECRFASQTIGVIVVGVPATGDEDRVASDLRLGINPFAQAARKLKAAGENGLAEIATGQLAFPSNRSPSARFLRRVCAAFFA